MTRTVSDGRGYSRFRLIHPVHEPAYVALTGILKTSLFGRSIPTPYVDGPEKRKALADRIQAYWDKNRSIPLAERWYRTLADDDAGHQAWLEAAQVIAQPEYVSTHPTGKLFATTIRKPKPGETPRLRGEPLRDGRSPSVDELMERRIETMRWREEDSDAMARSLEFWRNPNAAAEAAARR